MPEHSFQNDNLSLCLSSRFHCQIAASHSLCPFRIILSYAINIMTVAFSVRVVPQLMRLIALFSPQRPGVDPRTVNEEFVVIKMKLKLVSILALCFSVVRYHSAFLRIRSSVSRGWTMGPLKAAVQDTQCHPTPRIKIVLSWLHRRVSVTNL